MFVGQIFGEKEVYLAPMAVLHALLLHRRNFSSAAFANDMFWSHVDLSSSIEQFRIIMLLCQRFKGTTWSLPCSALARPPQSDANDALRSQSFGFWLALF